MFPRLWYLPSSWASQFSVHVTQFWHAVSSDFFVAIHTMFMLTLAWFLGSKVTCEPSSYAYRTFLGLIGKMSVICTSCAFPELSVNLEIFCCLQDGLSLGTSTVGIVVTLLDILARETQACECCHVHGGSNHSAVECIGGCCGCNQPRHQVLTSKFPHLFC
jgi:hypothetical protein